MFNAEDLLRYKTSAQGSTTVVVVPPGEYVGVIGDKIEFRENQGKKDPTKTYVFMDAFIMIDDARVREVTGRQDPRVRWSTIVDLTEDGRGLDMGKNKNVGLNRLREAVGQNVEGKDWSPTMLCGQALRVKVRNVPREDDPKQWRDEVESVMAIR